VLFDPNEKARSLTTFILIRHGMCDQVGRSIAGRAPGVHLNEEGRRQTESVANRLRPVSLAAVYSSPLERALETAGPIAQAHGLQPETLEGLTEIDFGEWTGRTLEELDQLPVWRSFNSFRSGTRIPGGEHMTQVLSRALGELERVRRAHPSPGAQVVLVSHGDVLRAILAYALGLSLDFMQRLEVSPASISILISEDWGNRVLQLNGTDRWPREIVTQRAG
jgi:probable phosphoglycerate mutase